MTTADTAPAGDSSSNVGPLPMGGVGVAPAARLSAGGWGWLLAILGWTTVLSFYQLDGGASFEPIDCWVAQTAREMRAAGDWLVPRFSGETRMQKSPGPYWAVMAASLLRGTPVDEASARIPNAIAAIGLVAIIFWLTLRIAGERAAVFAGFAASSSVLILWWSHRGASDLGLTLFTTLSLAALWIAVDGESRGTRRPGLLLLGYFAAGLGMLWKMPMPLVVVGLPAVVYVVIRWRWRVFRSGWHLLGLVVFLLPWLPWVIAVAATQDAALMKWKVEFLDRFTGSLPNVEGQRKPIFLLTYFGPPLLYCLPYSLSLPAALTRVFRKSPGMNRDGLLFLLIWFVSHFVFFTASAGKEWRYFLPALPPLYVLLGIELAHLFDPQRVRPAWLVRAVVGIVCFVLPAGLLGGGLYGLREWYTLRGQSELAPLHGWNEVWIGALVAGIVFSLGAVIAALLYSRRRTHAAFGTLVVMMYVLWLWAWPRVVPLVMSQRPFTDFAAQLNDPQKLPDELRGAVRHVGTQDARIIWYGDLRIPRAIDQLQLLLEQKAQRSLDYETRRYGEEMIKHLSQPEPVLYVAALADYLKFLAVAPEELAAVGQPLPPVHLWLQTRYGREGQHFVLFGNHVPPYTEPELRISDDVLARLKERGRRLKWPTTWPALPPTTVSATTTTQKTSTQPAAGQPTGVAPASAPATRGSEPE